MQYWRAIWSAIACLLLAACGDSAKKPSPSADAPDASAEGSGLLVPVECQGPETDCTAPQVELLERGPEVTCTLTEATSPRIEQTLTFDSVAPMKTVLFGPDASVWVERADGFARYNANQERTATIEPDPPRPRLAGTAPEASGAIIDSRGHLLRLAAMRGGPGLELRDYDETGELIMSRPLMDGTTNGRARIEDDGSLTLFYHYVPVPSGGVNPDPSRRTIVAGVARFDATGRPEWNQPVSSLLWPEEDARTVFALLERGFTIVGAQFPADVQPIRIAFARVTADGSVEWVRERRSEQLIGVRAFPEHGVAFGSFELAAAATPLFANAVLPDGTSSWTLDLEALAGSSSVLLEEMDAQGRIWVQASEPDRPEEQRMIAISADGQRCTAWTLPPCGEPAGAAPESDAAGVADAPSCFGYGMMQTEGGALYLTSPGTVLRAHFEATP